MRRVLPLAILLIFVVWLVGALGSGVAADTPVLVLAAEDPILRLPVSPDVDRIVSDLQIEFEKLAAVERDPRIAFALREISGDPDLLQRVATAPAEMFDNGKAAATATPVFSITLEPEVVTVVVTTVELVPAYGATAISREHEDGHALINRSVARRCAADALAAGVAAGYRGNSLINSMMAFMSDSADPVHAQYHSSVAGAAYGRHIRLADQAIDDVNPCG